MCCRRPVGGQGTSASYKSEASDVSHRTPASHRTQRQGTERSTRCLSNASPMHHMLRARPRTHTDTDQTPPQHRMPPHHMRSRHTCSSRQEPHARRTKVQTSGACRNTYRHVNMSRHLSICCNTCRSVATHVDMSRYTSGMLQHNSTCCNTYRYVATHVDQYVATHVNTLQHMSIPRNTCR